MHVALVCACLPFGKAFCRRYIPKLLGSSFHSRSCTTRTTIHSVVQGHLGGKMDELELACETGNSREGDLQLVGRAERKLDEEACSQTNGSLHTTCQAPEQVLHAI